MVKARRELRAQPASRWIWQSLHRARGTPAWVQARGLYFKGDQSPHSALLGHRCFMGSEGSVCSKGAQGALIPAAIPVLLSHPLPWCSQHQWCRRPPSVRPSPALSATGPATAKHLHFQQPGDLLAVLHDAFAPGKGDAGSLTGFTGTSTVLVPGEDLILPDPCILHLHALC